MSREKRLHFPICIFGSVTMEAAGRQIIRGILPAEGLVTVWGPPKCGKSFLTFDMAMHIALGIEYRGRRVTQGTVVYCALEGVSGFSARVEAFRQHRLANDHGMVPFYLMTRPLALASDVGEFLEDLKEQLPGIVRPVVVVLDTLNRCFVGSENDDKDMNAFIKAADRIRIELGCTVVVIHHSGVAGDRPRGHTSLGGAVDAQLAVRKAADGGITMTTEWMKDGGEGEVIASRLEVVEVGRDEDDEPITSCIVEPIDAGPAGNSPRTGGRRLSERNRLALEALKEAVITAGTPAPIMLGLPAGTRVVPPDAWKEELFRRGILDREAGNPREQFRRTKVDLMARAAVAERDGHLWIVS